MGPSWLLLSHCCLDGTFTAAGQASLGPRPHHLRLPVTGIRQADTTLYPGRVQKRQVPYGVTPALLVGAEEDPASNCAIPGRVSLTNKQLRELGTGCFLNPADGPSIRCPPAQLCRLLLPSCCPWLSGTGLLQALAWTGSAKAFANWDWGFS